MTTETTYTQIDMRATPETHVEVTTVVTPAGTLTLWLNIDGLCRVRVQGLAPAQYHVSSGAEEDEADGEAEAEA